ncbi:MAG: RNA polymerase sigma factor [Phycisphaeraceae bacterium]
MTRLPKHPRPTRRDSYRFDDYPPNPDDIRLAQPVVPDNLARKPRTHVPESGDAPADDGKKQAERRLRLAQMPRPKSHMDNLPKPGETQEQWYARIVGDYYRFLYATAYPIVRNAADAEDAVQTAIMNGLRRLDHLNDERAIVSWMAMIVRNAALDVVRKRKRTAGGPGSADAEEIQVAADEPDERYQMDEDQRDIVFDAVAELPDSQAAVITLRHVEGLEIAELADRLGITANNARVRLFRAYEKLRANPRVRAALGLDEA